MERKKTIQADLENERTTFFLLSFVVVLATLFVLFEWNSEETLSSDWEGFSSAYIIEEELAVGSREVESAAPISESVKDLPKIVYEDYNIVEEASAIQIVVSSLLEEVVRIRETEIAHEELLQEMLGEITHMDSEVMPQYFGGNIALVRFMFNNIQYPSDALQKKIQGRVWCSFIVDVDGSVFDIQVEQPLYPSLDQEALRVLKLMPPWIPGTFNGEFVRVKCYLPVVFSM